MKRSRLAGFTLVELLVVITIIGVLMALLLPAVQAAREAARRVQCKNNVRQLALASIIHADQHGHFPTGGWNRFRVGDADRGFREDQPGGWAYNILPFLEETSLYNLSGDGIPDVVTEQQLEGAGRLAATAIPVFNCPSRRVAEAYPFPADFVTLLNASLPPLIGKLDYAINVGEIGGEEMPGGRSPHPPGSPEWWCNDHVGNIFDRCTTGRNLYKSPFTGESGFHGISFRRSEISDRHITDGTTNTYLIGEKYVPPNAYDTIGWDRSESFREGGDYLPWCVGENAVVARWGASVPRRDRYGIESNGNFGSPHEAGFHLSFCDGSVRAIEYDIDPLVHLAASNRKDGTFQGHP